MNGQQSDMLRVSCFFIMVYNPEHQDLYPLQCKYSFNRVKAHAVESCTTCCCASPAILHHQMMQLGTLTAPNLSWMTDAKSVDCVQAAG